ncbi:MAG: DUF3500 domain-containing protein [Cytophagaceae bacterium]|nr:MAG: DUF3500 domain-containing protein [Cytophagaceae bacterium]
MRSSSFLLIGLFGLAAFSQLPVAAPPAKTIATTAQPAAETDVLRAATAFLASLSAEQRKAVIVAFNATNVTKWSNFPCGLGCRAGLLLKSLTPAQQAAALAVVKAATGTVANDGFNEIQQLRAADDVLSAAPGGGYGSDIYAIAFLGTPAATGTWMLQFGGHHLATNITFHNGTVSGASPKFEGAEPLTFTTANAKVLPTGTTCAPLSNEAAVMLALLNSLTPTQKTTAKLAQSFGDVLVGPGHDGQFPTTRVGLPGNALTASQKTLVLNAMKPWVQDADDATAASLLAAYEQQLAGGGGIVGVLHPGFHGV